MTLGYHCPNRPHRMAGGESVRAEPSHGPSPPKSHIPFISSFGFIPIAGRDAYVMRWQAWCFWGPAGAYWGTGARLLGDADCRFPHLDAKGRGRRGTVPPPPPPCPRCRAIYLMLDHLQLIDRTFLQAQGASLHQRWSDLALQIYQVFEPSPSDARGARIWNGRR